MHTGGWAMMADTLTCFYDTLTVAGWAACAGDALADVRVSGTPLVGQSVRVGLPHPAVEPVHGPDRGFRVQALLRGPLSAGAELVFQARSGTTGRFPLAGLRNERLDLSDSDTLARDFVRDVDAMPGARVLDIGGRDRSGVDRSRMFRRAACTVLDILPGANVNVVGDAHVLSRLFPPETFDALLSVSVFEHLMMPWTVAVEMNRVLKAGGLALVSSHQTLGMHEIPWDFWRFSDTSWHALFNSLTGFEVLRVALDGPEFVVPHVLRADQAGYEAATGFETSAALVRKIGPSRMQWDAAPPDITTTTYPANEATV